MKRRIFTLLLVVAMLVSVIALNSCDIIDGIINPGTGDNGGTGNNGGTGDNGETETKYTVTYVGGEGATGEAPATATCKAGTSILVAANTFTREGYIFAGWSYGDQTYNAGDFFTTPEENVVFTALWEVEPDIKNEVLSVVLQDMILTVTGTTNSASAKLFVGEEHTDSTRNNFYTDITIGADGSFTVSFDLNTLVADNDWYNTYIFLADESYMIVSLDQLTNGEGATYELWSWLELTENNLQICTWDANGINTLSFKIEKPAAPNPDYFLAGGQISASNKKVSIAEEEGKVYFYFEDEFVGGSNGAKTFELVFTVEDPADNPASLDASKILHTASNSYEGDNGNAFSFRVNLTTDVGQHNDWIRFVLKVTEGDTVSYYTIKPLVSSHNGDWVAFCDPIVVDGLKHELAICWSSVFVQVKP